ncbi:MAG: glycyl-radical enzyme activating protein [Oligosphaeraceae bacterium]|nr:glycyl-radical enzyme activating protein [Oligosphaeraceae bacterium]
MHGLIFAIEKFAVHDGPGIRTVVFFKGCPLHCLWCHNPESQSCQPEILFSPEKCIGCGWCLQACPESCHLRGANGEHRFERTHCRQCGLCTRDCYAGALEVAGQQYTVAEVIAAVMQDKVFYDHSGGGITLSGGEPMAQFPFALALLQTARKQGLHTCLETCGQAPYRHFRQLLPLVDLFLYDYKATDPGLHRELTGVNNEQILTNLRQLDRDGAKIILRCPLVPGINDDPGHLAGIASIANSLRHIQQIDLEPYHPLGSGKCQRLGREYPLALSDFTPEERISGWLNTVQSQTAVPVQRS